MPINFAKFSLKTSLSRLLRFICRLCYLYLCVVRYAEAESLTDAQIKAAYLYNFTNFAEWPSDSVSSGSKTELCLLGIGPVNDAIKALDGRKNRELSFRVNDLNNSAPNFAGCDLLFINKSEHSRFLVILKSIENLPILTLSDIEDFAVKGGNVGFVIHENKVVFEVNLDSLKSTRIRLPGQLLNLAHHVYGKN
jgi:hypothetical protein